MCGISGVIHRTRSVSWESLQVMSKAMVHRGPDDEGSYINAAKDVGLCFRRLSIIDITGGHQPLTNEDGSKTIVFNGEVYNFKELKTELLANGHRFTTNTDTEVVLHGFEDKGLKSVEDFNGMFAYAIWDEGAKHLSCFRDRMGKKPFYYYLDDEYFVFASELKSIWSFFHKEGKPLMLDESIPALFLIHKTYIPSPHTIWKNVFQLPPGHLLDFDKKAWRLRVERYWRVPLPSKSGTSEDTNIADLTNDFETLFESSVQYRLISDVPIGVLLSGGIDSSLIAAYAAKAIGSNLNTFTISFDEYDFDESPYAEYVSKLIGSNHRTLKVEVDFLKDIEKIFRQFDNPFADSSQVPTYYVSKLASEYVKVVLGGDGGDELFAGYEVYKKQLDIDRWRYLVVPGLLKQIYGVWPEWMKGKNFLKRLSLSLEESYYFDYSLANFSSLLGEQALASFRMLEDPYCLFRNYWPTESSIDDLLKMQYCDANLYLPEDILQKVDRSSMANSLEVRAPFLDYRIIDFAFIRYSQLPIQQRIGKRILKILANRLFDKSFVNRKKKGFGMPVDRWFREKLGDYIHDTVLSTSFSTHGFFNKKKVLQLLDYHKRGFRDFGSVLWIILAFEKWAENYLDCTR